MTPSSSSTTDSSRLALVGRGEVLEQGAWARHGVAERMGKKANSEVWAGDEERTLLRTVYREASQ